MSASGRLRQEDCVFKTSLGNLAILQYLLNKKIEEIILLWVNKKGWEIAHVKAVISVPSTTPQQNQKTFLHFLLSLSIKWSLLCPWLNS